MEVTQTFSATSAAAGRRLSARTLAGWLSHLPPPGGCLQPLRPSATRMRRRCRVPVIVRSRPMVGRIAGLVALSFWHRTSGGL
jgi:hypothetical protein